MTIHMAVNKKGLPLECHRSTVMQIFDFPLPKTHKCRFQSTCRSLSCVNQFAGRIIVEFGAFSWAQVVIFVALACHVADTHPRFA